MSQYKSFILYISSVPNSSLIPAGLLAHIKIYTFIQIQCVGTKMVLRRLAAVNPITAQIREKASFKM